jgi:hypothetical protein
LTYCRVRADQLGYRVICPECRSKFTAVRESSRHINAVGAATGVLIVVALGIVIMLKLR